MNKRQRKKAVKKALLVKKYEPEWLIRLIAIIRGLCKMTKECYPHGDIMIGHCPGGDAIAIKVYGRISSRHDEP